MWIGLWAPVCDHSHVLYVRTQDVPTHRPAYLLHVTRIYTTRSYICAQTGGLSSTLHANSVLKLVLILKNEGSGRLGNIRLKLTRRCGHLTHKGSVHFEHATCAHTCCTCTVLALHMHSISALFFFRAYACHVRTLAYCTCLCVSCKNTRILYVHHAQ